MRLCLELPDLTIKLEQSEDKQARFRVTYGLSVASNLSYSDGMKELGKCVFHALACNGELNNEGV